MSSNLHIMVITYDNIRCNIYLELFNNFLRRYSCVVTTKKEFLAFRVSPALKGDIQEIAKKEARSISQICELLLVESVEAYRKEGPKFIQRLVAKHNARTK